MIKLGSSYRIPTFTSIDCTLMNAEANFSEKKQSKILKEPKN